MRPMVGSSSSQGGEIEDLRDDEGSIARAAVKSSTTLSNPA